MRRLLTSIPNLRFTLALAVLIGIALLAYQNAQSVGAAAESQQHSLVRLDLLQEFLAARAIANQVTLLHYKGEWQQVLHILWP